jgi:drug/metabolite transporter (DMT)-like permease
MMKSRGEILPPAEGAGIPRAILQWFSDPVWLGGLLCETLGYVLYFAALAYAPVSLVAVMMQGGIAAFVLVAIIFLHERASRSEAAGIAGIVLAMVLIALSSPGGTPESGLRSDALGVLSAVFALTAAMPWLITRLRQNGTAPAIASGIAFGLGSLYTKALAEIFTANSGFGVAVHIVASPWFYLMIGGNVGGLVLLQNSFHWARGIIAMPLSSAISNLVPIMGGIVAFSESLPSDTIAASLRIAAFLLTVMSGLLLAKGA